MPNPLENLRSAYAVLLERVTRALRTQVGDATRLGLQRAEVLRLLEAAQPHQGLFPPAEFATLQTSIATMVEELDRACHQSSDPQDAPSLVVASHARTGRPGRPRVYIDPTFLAEAMSLRGPTGLQPIFNCSARTIRRRALESGLVAPGEAVYTSVSFDNGSTGRVYAQRTLQSPPFTDDQLDSLVSSILEIFPAFGRRMISGRLKASGHHIPRERIAAAYLRVHGSPGVFGDRSIHRDKYRVAGANSLWHHDGQHGLIRFKIVIHCFIDGKSRFITGIHAANNNEAQTVLNLFLLAMSSHGIPSRLRGDHGTENMLAAQWMIDHHGEGRGSYIWGRSVHNTRIERLWYDVTHGFGQKWKAFFIDLEVHHGLNPRRPADIWLLQHLFLDAINQDAQEWAEAWNSHKLQIRGERERSPRDIFVFSMVQDGPRGIHHTMDPVNEEVVDPATYGIDWDVVNDPALMNHLLMQNPQDWADDNPFTPGPAALSHVPCDPPQSPLTIKQVDILNAALAERVDLSSRNMQIHRLVWLEAVNICRHLML